METEDGIERKETDREAIYRTSCAKMRGIRNAGMQQEAIDLLKTISDYADADERIALCEQRIKALHEQENAVRIETEHTAKKRRTAAVIALSALAFCAVGTVLLFTAIFALRTLHVKKTQKKKRKLALETLPRRAGRSSHLSGMLKYVLLSYLTGCPLSELFLFLCGAFWGIWNLSTLLCLITGLCKPSYASLTEPE